MADHWVTNSLLEHESWLKEDQKKAIIRKISNFVIVIFLERIIHLLQVYEGLADAFVGAVVAVSP